MRRGDHAAASRALSLVVDGDPAAETLAKDFFRSSGTVQKLGVSGPPGAGKSTLTGRLIGHFRTLKLKVGILAVDPSSSISGGAFLGDRLRIMEHATDPGVGGVLHDAQSIPQKRPARDRRRRIDGQDPDLELQGTEVPDEPPRQGRFAGARRPGDAQLLDRAGGSEEVLGQGLGRGVPVDDEREGARRRGVVASAHASDEVLRVVPSGQGASL